MKNEAKMEKEIIEMAAKKGLKFDVCEVKEMFYVYNEKSGEVIFEAYAISDLHSKISFG